MLISISIDHHNHEAALPGITPESEAVTAELAPDADREVVCWTCGTQIQREVIGDRIADLRDVIDEKRATRDERDARIEELQERRQEIEQAIDRRETLSRQLTETEEKIAARTEEIDELEATADQLREAISTLESEAADTQELRDHDLLEKYERLSDLQYERGQLQQQLDDITAEITDIEELPAKQTLETQQEEIQAELEDERTRIEDLETMAVDAFNEHMDELLEILAYENLARVWLEPRQPEPKPGPGEPETAFDLHVIRESRDGTGYEDDVANLSESEREIIGLVVALAGYLTHEVFETVPFMLLDSVEAIDADRLATLIEYFATYAPYLIMAVLPEDAAALDDEYERVSADMLAA